MRSEQSLLDVRSLRERVIETLHGFPDGATTRDLAAKLGDPQYSISSVVSKIFLYGGPIEKIGHQFGPGTKWRLRRKAP